MPPLVGLLLLMVDMVLGMVVQAAARAMLAGRGGGQEKEEMEREQQELQAQQKGVFLTPSTPHPAATSLSSPCASACSTGTPPADPCTGEAGGGTATAVVAGRI